MVGTLMIASEAHGAFPFPMRTLVGAYGDGEQRTVARASATAGAGVGGVKWPYAELENENNGYIRYVL